MNDAVRYLARDIWKGITAVVDAAGRVLLVALVWFYRLVLRPLFPTSCRFEPSCSEYALQAVKRFGPVQGGWLAVKRLGRCNPWGPWGNDPVPQKPHQHLHQPACGHEHARLPREYP